MLAPVFFPLNQKTPLDMASKMHHTKIAEYLEEVSTSTLGVSMVLLEHTILYHCEWFQVTWASSQHMQMHHCIYFTCESLMLQLPHVNIP